ncbi:hypothetical protein TWF481_008719 [Arthrobotrys musiformis]|uniref:Uncharacterized protein n=1 Tax=Arthrobotrys musiformis TaxID=47236 RepID=A0AAV9W805_9PEZI
MDDDESQNEVARPRPRPRRQLQPPVKKVDQRKQRMMEAKPILIHLAEDQLRQRFNLAQITHSIRNPAGIQSIYKGLSRHEYPSVSLSTISAENRNLIKRAIDLNYITATLSEPSDDGMGSMSLQSISPSPAPAPSIAPPPPDAATASSTAIVPTSAPQEPAEEYVVLRIPRKYLTSHLCSENGEDGATRTAERTWQDDFIEEQRKKIEEKDKKIELYQECGRLSFELSMLRRKGKQTD